MLLGLLEQRIPTRPAALLAERKRQVAQGHCRAPACFHVERVGSQEHLEPPQRLRRLHGGPPDPQIGRASCRERVWISVVGVALQKRREGLDVTKRYLV